MLRWLNFEEQPFYLAKTFKANIKNFEFLILLTRVIRIKFGTPLFSHQNNDTMEIKRRNMNIDVACTFGLDY
jgi:hypothetical protein